MYIKLEICYIKGFWENALHSFPESQRLIGLKRQRQSPVGGGQTIELNF